MDYYNIAFILQLSGMLLQLSGISSVLTTAIRPTSIDNNDGVYEKVPVSFLGCGSILTSLAIPANYMGQNQAYEEATSYVQTLSTEELEALSEDLVSSNISDSDIEDELSDRLNTLSDNEGLFSSDEEREILQESLADYLGELSNTDYEEYEMVLETLSDSAYEAGELTDELAKDEVVKKLNL